METMKKGMRYQHMFYVLVPYDTVGAFSAFQRIRFFINDTLIYDSKDQNLIYHGIDKTDGSFWCLVSLPGDYKGKMITMEIRPLSGPVIC